MRLERVSGDERCAVERLLGRPPGRGEGVTVDLAELARSGAAPDLTSALAVIHGPIADKRAERAAWEAVWDRAAAPARERGLEPWLAELRASGVLRRLATDADEAEALLSRFWLLVDHLPGGGRPLSALAAAVAGDAHALDPGRPLAALARRYLRKRAGEEAEDDPHTLWALAGVRVGGGVTSRVLVLNMPASGSAPTDRLLATAADRLGGRSAPLVCTDGHAGAAVITLLRGLRAAGCALFHQGDFDWGGLAIGQRVIGALGARPWRFDAAAYRDAAARHPGRPLTAPARRSAFDLAPGPASPKVLS